MSHDPIAAYYALGPTTYRALVRLTLSQGDSDIGEMEQYLDVILAEGAELAGPTLHVRFEGVRNLQLQQSDLSLITFSHIEIGRAEAGFVVKSEDGLLRFTCRTFTCGKVEAK